MNDKLEPVYILGVRIDRVNLHQAAEQIMTWLKGRNKHYVVTTNVEFIMKAQKDSRFKEVLNNADLAVPDSLRLGWANFELNQKSLLKKIIFWPFFLFPVLLPKPHFPVVGGVYLLEKLCQRAAQEGFSVGFLGGKEGVVKKAAQKLQKKYPGLKLTIAEDGPVVNLDGNEVAGSVHSSGHTDILFVAFGQVKQEKWIAKNLPHLPVKVAMGVGGSFDEISGEVMSAPGWIWNLGFKWLFRLILQPWRITRFKALVKFVFLILVSPRV